MREDEGQVEVCVRMIDLPSGGLECDVSASLSTVDGAKTGSYVRKLCINIST